MKVKDKMNKNVFTSVFTINILLPIMHINGVFWDNIVKRERVKLSVSVTYRHHHVPSSERKLVVMNLSSSSLLHLDSAFTQAVCPVHSRVIFPSTSMTTSCSFFLAPFFQHDLQMYLLISSCLLSFPCR